MLIMAPTTALTEATRIPKKERRLDTVSSGGMAAFLIEGTPDDLSADYF
jgi:hypothetical protein